MLIKTHYDNLNIARSASSEAIRAAFKALSQTHHANAKPTTEASSAFKKISHSFAVLSNPVQRAEYDQWILAQESSQIGQANASSTEKKQSGVLRWLIFAGIALATLLALKWFGVFGENVDTKSEQSALPNELTSQQSLSNSTAGQIAQPVALTENTQSMPMVVSNSMPDHDPVSIDQFVGLWKGTNGETGGQQTLDISLKSDHSIVFNLDAKAGQSIGGVYGIAEFANSYANFFSKDYNCSILFTIKSGVLQLNTSSCQAYHESGIAFDGNYNKPSLTKSVVSPSVAQANSTAKISTAKIVQTPPTETTPAVAINAPQLLKFVVTVKDATGKTSKIELIAKDKDAARAIIRDFRGNPEIVKIKEIRN